MVDVTLDDEEDVYGASFQDVNAKIADMEVQHWENGERENDVEIEEEPVGPGTNDGECGSVDQKGGTDGCQAEYYVDVLNAFEEKRVLDIEVQVERGMD